MKSLPFSVTLKKPLNQIREYIRGGKLETSATGGERRGAGLSVVGAGVNGKIVPWLA
jgi:hypothetical protein